MTVPGDLEALILRLDSTADQLDPDQPPIAPPIGEWHQRLAELRERLDSPFPLLDPQAPMLVELLAMDRDADSFIEGTYQHLLGRKPDPSGKQHYLAQCRTQGRLVVLAALSCSEESIYHRKLTAMRLPPALLRLLRWQQRIERLGPLRRLGEKLLQRTLSRLSQHNAERWMMDAALCRQMVHQSQWSQERQQLASAVLEMDDRQRHFGQRQDHEYARQQALWQQLAAWRRAGSVPARPTTKPEVPPTTAPVTMPPSELDAYYLAFEAAFRGPETDISDHLNHYCDAWTRAREAGDQALDLGCGRGEWLRLLTQAGFQPRGIDLNTTMVDHCCEQGFNVKQQDALEALRDSADASLALISGFHIAEHLPFEVLFNLVAEAYRALAPGGVLVLETPNPENLIVASYSFYHDLTHRNPLTPPTLQFLLQFHGFGNASIQRFNPPPDDTHVPSDSPSAQRLNAMLAAPMDYAVIGTKAAMPAYGDAATQQDDSTAQTGGKHP